MFKFIWIALLVYVADQLTKHAAVTYLMGHDIAVTPFLNLSLAFNTGAAFSFLSSASGWQNGFFIIVGIVASIVILVMISRLGPGDVQAAVALMLILGGAAGNVTDRMVHGYVVDFLDLYYRSWHWPTFNVADSAITVGAALLLMDALGLRFRRRDRSRT
ncbi:MAG: signal peptidase II [Gammaproteobacteria bacterium]|nr:signal peptidase II [Gammaproteobacteria bacterium]